MTVEVETPELPPQHQNVQPGSQRAMHPKPISVNPKYRPAGKLEGMKAFITGGDSGIGCSVALHYILEGADVAIGCHPSELEDASDTKHACQHYLDQIEDHPAYRRPTEPDFIVVPGDLAIQAECVRSIKAVFEHFGHLNILVLNAAMQHVDTEGIEEIDAGRLEHLMRVNLLANLYLVRQVILLEEEYNLPASQRCSSIIVTSSIQAYKGNAGMLEYSISKGALVAMVRSLSLMLGPSVRVNGVAPTPLIPSTMPAEDIPKFGKNTPMGRYGQPAEVGPSFVFLASEDASYISGQFIHPNGGTIVNA